MKAVLVINMPEDFDYRRCSIGGDGNIYYEREGEQRASIIGNIRNLKPMPKERELKSIEYLEHYRLGMTGAYEREAYSIGWNDCIDEITGETE